MPDALAAIRAHVAAFPREAMALAPATGVFGLVGFSGCQEREEELFELLGDVHRAVACAATGNSCELEQLIGELRERLAAGTLPAGEVVARLAD